RARARPVRLRPRASSNVPWASALPVRCAEHVPAIRPVGLGEAPAPAAGPVLLPRHSGLTRCRPAPCVDEGTRPSAENVPTPPPTSDLQPLFPDRRQVPPRGPQQTVACPHAVPAGQDVGAPLHTAHDRPSSCRGRYQCLTRER